MIGYEVSLAYFSKPVLVFSEFPRLFWPLIEYLRTKGAFELTQARVTSGLRLPIGNVHYISANWA